MRSFLFMERSPLEFRLDSDLIGVLGDCQGMLGGYPEFMVFMIFLSMHGIMIDRLYIVIHIGCFFWFEDLNSLFLFMPT